MTDITELAQLRGRTVDYPYYLVECDCGKIYPSSELSGGEPMGDSGDYSDCYCPHCGEGEEHFAECADPETAWKAQQDKIDALVEVLEKAQQHIARQEQILLNQDESLSIRRGELEAAHQRIAQLESRTVTPVTYSENADADYCRKWAWEQVKGEVSTEDWTTGDSITYFGFFCWGWDMRRQYNEQRPVTVKLPQRLQPGADGWDDWYMHSDDEGEYLKFDDVLAMLTAAGIKVEAE
ncbi:hypothetical protein RHA54_24540 [Klebsiella pneumoniae]|nr:hypothetical protein [Klebsiella pneumoniae]